MIVSLIMLALSLVFAAALGWKIFQLVKAPRDAALRAVTLCLISAACSFVLAREPFADWIASAGGPGAPRLVQNLFVLSMAYWLMCFYLYSAAADASEGSTRARREALLLALAATGLLTATITAGVGDDGANFRGSDLRDPALVSFYLVADLYLVYALAMALRWTCAYARASQRPLATGLWITAVAIGTMAASCTIRTVLTVVRWQGGTVPQAVTWASSVMIALAVPLFLIGVSYPGAATRIAAVRIRRQHRRLYRRLGRCGRFSARRIPNTLSAGCPPNRGATTCSRSESTGACTAESSSAGTAWCGSAPTCHRSQARWRTIREGPTTWPTSSSPHCATSSPQRRPLRPLLSRCR